MNGVPFSVLMPRISVAGGEMGEFIAPEGFGFARVHFATGSAVYIEDEQGNRAYYISTTDHEPIDFCEENGIAPSRIRIRNSGTSNISISMFVHKFSKNYWNPYGEEVAQNDRAILGIISKTNQLNIDSDSRTDSDI